MQATCCVHQENPQLNFEISVVLSTFGWEPADLVGVSSRWEGGSESVGGCWQAGGLEAVSRWAVSRWAGGGKRVGCLLYTAPSPRDY